MPETVASPTSPNGHEPGMQSGARPGGRSSRTVVWATLFFCMTTVGVVHAAGNGLAWIDGPTDQILFTVRDIRRFDWDRQLIELKPDPAIRLAILSHVWLDLHWQHRPFVVRDNQGTIYGGRFTGPFSSTVFEGVSIKLPLPITAEHPDSMPVLPLLNVEGPPVAPLRVNGTRFDPRLRADLEGADCLARIAPDDHPPPLRVATSPWTAGRSGPGRIMAIVFVDSFRSEAGVRALLRFDRPVAGQVDAPMLRVRPWLSSPGWPGSFRHPGVAVPVARVPGRTLVLHYPAGHWERPAGLRTFPAGPATVAFEVTAYNAKGSDPPEVTNTWRIDPIPIHLAPEDPSGTFQAAPEG